MSVELQEAIKNKVVTTSEVEGLIAENVEAMSREDFDKFEEEKWIRISDLFNEDKTGVVDAFLRDHVTVPQKELQDYVNFVDNLRTHPKSHVMLVKYEIYKKLLAGDTTP